LVKEISLIALFLHIVVEREERARLSSFLFSTVLRLAWPKDLAHLAQLLLQVGFKVYSHLVVGAFNPGQAGEALGLFNFLKDLFASVHQGFSSSSFFKQVISDEHGVLLALVGVFVQDHACLLSPLVDLVNHLLVHKVCLLKLYLVRNVGRMQVIKHLHLYGSESLSPGLKALLN
jgi:hypothetical protein